MKRWLVVLAVGCGGKPPPSCAAVAEIAHGLWEHVPISTMVAERCETDQWSAAARACMIAANKPSDFHACRAQLTTDQRAGLARAMDAVIAEVSLSKRVPAPPSDAAASLAFVISVRGEHQLEVAGRSIDDAELDRALHALDPSTQVVIRAEPGVPHGAVVRVLEQAKAAGLTKLAIATEAVH